jgi:hypothetical protein
MPISGELPDVCDVTSSLTSEVIMPDTHAHHRPPRGERRSGDSRPALLPATPAALIRASLFPFALLLFIAAPPASARLNTYCVSEASSGDPDDGDHRDSPTLMSVLVMTEPLPAVTLAESTAPSLASSAVEPQSAGRAYALRSARFPGLAFLWSVVRVWMLHR